MRLVDSHGHVQADAFSDDVEAVITAAAEAGVERLLAPGWDLPSSRAAVELAIRFPRGRAEARAADPLRTMDDAPPLRTVGAAPPRAAAVPPVSGVPTPDMSGPPLGVDAAVGIHPHVASSVDAESWAAVEALATRPEVLAIGETGLDYDRAFSPRDAQLANLRNHLALGRRTGKPVILHCRSAAGMRDAHDDLLRELRAAGVGDAAWAERLAGRPPAVLHSFSGPVDYAEEALALGLGVSFSGLVFRRGEEASARVAMIVPTDRLLVETDAPYLSPPGAPRRRNEPRWVRVTAEWLAQQRGEDPRVVGEALVRAYDGTFVGQAGGAQA